jgi:carbonic anhydrase
VRSHHLSLILSSKISNSSIDENLCQVDYFDGRLTFKKYGKISEWRSIQFHFHHPAEHHVDGIIYDAEMHMVFQGVTHEKEVSVLGLLFEANDDVEEDQFLKSMHLDQLEHPVSSKGGLNIDLKSLYGNLEGYQTYNYPGSLTMPPYTECVNWNIFTKPRQIPSKQLKALEDMWGGECYPQCFRGNSRFVFDHGIRTVREIKHTNKK